MDHKNIELSDKEALEKIGPEAAKNIVKNKWSIGNSSSERSMSNAYSYHGPKKRILFDHSCDFLQYSIAVKPYIYKKYNIKHSIELDILLFMYPIQFFTRDDFNLLPVRMYNYQFKTLMELGYFERLVDHRKKNLSVYGLTDHAKKIVTEYYMYLSGERVINPKNNVFRSRVEVKADKMRERLMLKLRAQADRNPYRFKKYY